ncbi:hypothetical protein DPMN_192409 [Dreissena polymorpha]|uniref:G-protein coupled receptors family 1 profile domain-containing protein n=1 Tax=Dreissena polymorpha TaxID=45954 RepID=A0A9D3Y1I1_DREPO|nr:hypothetical protein DPMN_192409 [Dreissena polymorpha]
MAVADLLTGGFDAVVRAIELTAGNHILVMPWSAGTQACKLQRSLVNACAMASNFLLATTSLDRAIVIAKPMIHFKRGFVMQKVLTASCWIISICGSIPVYISFHLKQYHVRGINIEICDA